jgi:hypothetical protein
MALETPLVVSFKSETAGRRHLKELALFELKFPSVWASSGCDRLDSANLGSGPAFGTDPMVFKDS